jgi:hypothetical protein
MIDPTKISPAQPEGGLSSFANLLSMILGFDESEDGFSYATYLTCLGLMPHSARKPTHPFFFPTSFPPEGSMVLLLHEVADRVEDAIAELCEVRSQLANYDSPTEIAAETVDELGRKAMAAVRRLGAALGYRRWDSGETMVKMLQFTQALPPTKIGGAELVQSVNEFGNDCYVWENPEESNNRIRVGALRLVFRLAPSESIDHATPQKLAEWRTMSQQIAAVHNALFPGEHCIVEFRDHTAATLSRTEPIGPSYADVVAQREASRSNREQVE